MGKKSVKENKNIYQISREEIELTREKASELMQCISPDRIEKIENEKTFPHPDEILVMAECYKKPNLTNYYCANECPIGKKYVPEVQMKELSQIVLEILSTLNSVEKQKNRLIEITVDGKITQDELQDFTTIQDTLNKVSLTIDSLQLWIQDSIMKGEISKEALSKTK